MSPSFPFDQLCLSDAVPHQPLPASPALASKLEALGMWDMQGWLCGPMNLRSLRAFANLLDDEFTYVCQLALAASFLPGHIATLRALRAEALMHVALDASGVRSSVANKSVASEHAVGNVGNAETILQLLHLPSEADSKSKEAVVWLDIAQSSFFSCSPADLPESLALSNIAADFENVLARHRAAQVSATEPAAAELAKALDCLEELDQPPIEIANVRLECFYEALGVAKKATQDALLYCLCNNMDDETRNNTKKAKLFVKEGCDRAFGRSVSNDIISRLQNARHQLFFRTDGAKPMLLSIPLELGQIENVASCTKVENHCLRIQSIDIHSVLGQWNMKHPDQQVHVGDRIVRVGDIWAKMGVLEVAQREGSTSLEILVLRDIKRVKKKKNRGRCEEASSSNESPPNPTGEGTGSNIDSHFERKLCEDADLAGNLAQQAPWPSDARKLILAKNTFIEDCISEVSGTALSRANTCPGPAAPSKQSKRVCCLLGSGLMLGEALTKILGELEPALHIDWSNTDEVDEASFEVIAARSLLLEVADLPQEKIPDQWRKDLPSLQAWVRAETDEHFGQVDLLPMRLKLLGLLFGSETILELLREYIQQLDENFVTSVLRSFMQLRQLCQSLVSTVVSHDVVEAVLDHRFLPQKKHCHSACAGVLGTFGCTEDQALQHRIIDMVLEMAKYWLGQRGRNEACLYECFWALNCVCTTTGDAGSRLSHCEEIASSVLEDARYQWCDDAQWCHREEHKLLFEAKKLKALVAPDRSL